MEEKSLTSPEKWILWGIPAIFAVGALFHFLYELLGNCPVVGAFAPVNESVWEHCKMVVLPVILWWGLYYIFRGQQQEIDKDKWFTAALAAMMTALALIPLLFYFYTSAFGVELLWVDVLILLLAVACGQLVGLHVYQYGEGIPAGVALGIMAAIVLVFVLFTFCTPQLPIFKDSVTGHYGI